MLFKMFTVLKVLIDTPRMNHEIVVIGFDIRILYKEIPALPYVVPSSTSGFILVSSPVL